MEYNEYARIKMKKLRRENNIKQAEFAELIGLSLQKYTSIESGEEPLTPIVMLQVLYVLRTNSNEFNKEFIC